MPSVRLAAAIVAVASAPFIRNPADAQVPDGQALSLSGYTPTMDLNAARGFNLVSGELPWWSVYQLPPKPFSLSVFPVSLGLPPNAAWHASSVAPTASLAGFDQPYFSGYTNEAEAYPNADELLQIEASSQPTPAMTLSSGVISLVANRISSAESAALPAQLAGRGFVSGAINTYPYAQRYGYVELDGQIPAGAGLWPAFWMVPENMNAGGDTEIDVMEVVAGQTKILYSTLHTTDPTSPSYPSLTHAYTSPVDLSAGYHRFGVDWEPVWTTFYLDGISIYSARTPADMKQPMYIIADLAVGTATAWGGAPNGATKFPATFNIDDIRVWAPKQ